MSFKHLRKCSCLYVATEIFQFRPKGATEKFIFFIHFMFKYHNDIGMGVPWFIGTEMINPGIPTHTIDKSEYELS